MAPEVAWIKKLAGNSGHSVSCQEHRETSAFFRQALVPLRGRASTARQFLQTAEFALGIIPNRSLNFGQYNETHDLLWSISTFLGDADVRDGQQQIRSELQLLEYIETTKRPLKRPLTLWECNRRGQLEAVASQGGA